MAQKVMLYRIPKEREGQFFARPDFLPAALFILDRGEGGTEVLTTQVLNGIKGEELTGDAVAREGRRLRAAGAVPVGVLSPLPPGMLLAGSYLDGLQAADATAQDLAASGDEGYRMYIVASAQEEALLDALDKAGAGYLYAQRNDGFTEVLSDGLVPDIASSALTADEAAAYDMMLCQRPEAQLGGAWEKDGAA